MIRASGHNPDTTRDNLFVLHHGICTRRSAAILLSSTSGNGCDALSRFWFVSHRVESENKMGDMEIVRQFNSEVRRTQLKTVFIEIVINSPLLRACLCTRLFPK